MRDAVADFLRDEGWDVTEVETGDAAIRLLETKAGFDVVLTDRMPGAADGIEVASRALGGSPRIPALIVFGYAQELEHRLQSLEPPPTIMPKPFRLSQLSQALRRLLAT